MPIRPERKHLYPRNWAWIRRNVLARATDRFGVTRCEGSPDFPDCRAANWWPHPDTGSKVVLTIAHLDHDETVSDPLRLRAWCQRCHITYDAPRKAKELKERRRAKLAAADLFEP